MPTLKAQIEMSMLQADFGLDGRQAKRREIVRTTVCFAERRGYDINWIAAIRYILTGDGNTPIIAREKER